MPDLTARAAVLAALSLLLPSPAAGQEPGSQWERSFYNLERSHIAYPAGQGLVFEAQLAPQIVVAQTVRSLFAEGLVAADTAPHWGFGVVLSPMVRLRMVDEASQPVRTPSYMPHATAQLFRVRNLGRGRLESELRRGPFEMWTAQVTLSHHSNGQDGCLYTTQVRTLGADGAVGCDFLPGERPDPSDLNLRDGSFSTNFVRAGVFYRRLYLGTDAPTHDDAVRLSWYAGADAASHRSFLSDWIPGTIPADQQELYGAWRWRVAAGLAVRHRGRLPGGHFVDVVFERSPDAAASITGWALSLDYFRSFDRFGGWGLYAGYFVGQDYYNLAFGRKLHRLSVGLSWVQERFETLGAPALGPG